MENKKIEDLLYSLKVIAKELKNKTICRSYFIEEEKIIKNMIKNENLFK
jgi:hypothetical protein